jgi:hypothetical protein
MSTKKIFLASSSELKEDREQFEIFVNRRNKDWAAKGVFLHLDVWEDFLDAMSQTRLQDEYNKAIRECDLFVMLFFTKVGQYTAEEFETAFKQFKATGKPFVFTYFKDAQISTGSANEDDLMSLFAFKKKLAALGHFYTAYKNIEELQLKFGQQLDKLAAGGFIEFKPDKDCSPASGATTYQANVTGSGAIAQGPGAVAVGAGGVHVGGSNRGSINTGTRIDTGGGAYVDRNVQAGSDFVGRDKITQGIPLHELETLFAPLLVAAVQHAPPGKQAEAVRQVEELKAETAKGKQADDGRIAKIVEGLADMIPGAVGSVLSLFAAPILGGIAGPVTQYVLDKLKGN